MREGIIQILTYGKRSDLTQDELLELKESRKKILLVIKIRWVILCIFLVYGFAALYFYSLESAAQPLSINLAIPVVAYIFAVAYNGWYHYSYKWFLSLRHLNLIQIFFDLLYTTLVIHISGGAISWFWGVYLVLIIEGAFLAEKPYDAWVVAAGSLFFYGALLLLEYYRFLVPVSMPFDNNSVQHNISYLMLKWAWVTSLCFIVSGISSHIMGRLDEQDKKLRKMVITDSLTGLYNRKYFTLRLNSELQRAKRYGGTFSLLLMDIDNFKRVNDTWGHRTGDMVLQEVSRLIRKSIRRNENFPQYDLDIPCRIGGEEFAIILPAASSLQGSMAAERLRDSIEVKGALVVAEKIRKKVEGADFHGIRITVSVGVASYPEHGDDRDVLFRAADSAMYAAKERGKNRVMIAEIEEVL